MENILGLLRITIQRGKNLAKRDARSSDPYVIVRLGKQQVYDKDTFSPDDKMGDAELDIKTFVEAAKRHLQNLPSGSIIAKIKPTRENCIAEESSIIWENGKVIQHMFLRLRNVECGEIELQLQWIEIHGS
ncbi:C2-DOMAIN ABA-RELATED 4-like [Olea europaea subsp. europaea]|uniref:C2-DOMAIN ABA-RELATED 4-like n=1 Tax=Olea europaea subsp. europaea TaxID=158383 RepID=A0A8S0Q9B3_OLEEU|nr:C2-DOMAIN ABA-RELATED 4-like [Olea europaea subsp. europaea]